MGLISAVLNVIVFVRDGQSSPKKSEKLSIQEVEDPLSSSVGHQWARHNSINQFKFIQIDRTS